MNTCFYGVVLDLELVPVRSAPGKLVTGRTVRTSAVLEPEDQPSPRIALPGPSSSSAPYRIPRIPRSVPAQVKGTTHRLSARKATVLADKEFKGERKRNRKVCRRYNYNRASRRAACSLAIACASPPNLGRRGIIPHRCVWKGCHEWGDT